MKQSALFVGIFIVTTCLAQHEHPMPSDSLHHQMMMMMNPPMSHAYSLGLPMTRNGSGTGWMPDSSVMYGHGVMTTNWMFMFHYNLFVRYAAQDLTGKNNRGDSKFDAPNWLMGMGQRNVGNNGLFHFSAMLSLDVLTVGKEGYPLLFQTGETYQNHPLVDRQHPHDLFSELSIGYTQRFTDKVDLSFYLAYPGEPALGPVAFMHRESALNNPDAPLSHHWQDATHISFGVATVGLRVGIVKVEGSVFTGREPDENRFDFDRPTFDSYSLRILCNPTPALALQVSQALIVSPEALHPSENITRSTASVIHHLKLRGYNRYVATSLVWGFNNTDIAATHSILIEPNVQLDRFAVYSRFEWVQKTAEDLDLPEYNRDVVFNIQQLTLGSNFVLLRRFGSNLAFGLQGTVYFAKELRAFYGDRPIAAEVYIRFYPVLMHTHEHEHEHM